LRNNLVTNCYSCQGWEKIRPEKELLRAKKQILKCKLSIHDVTLQRDSLRFCHCFRWICLSWTCEQVSKLHIHILC